MKLTQFIKDKKIIIMFHLLLNLLCSYFYLLVFKRLEPLLIFLLWINLIFFFYLLLYYLRIKKLIDNLIMTESKLKQKFLIKDVQRSLKFEETLIFDVIDKISKEQYKEIIKMKNELKEERESKIIWVHEMKQPLSILNTDNIDNFNRKKAVNRINQKLEYILKYEKINNLGSDINFTKVNVYNVIMEVLQTFKYELINLDAKININIKEEHFIFTDKFWLKFIVEQIIFNSIKYKSEEQLMIKFSSELKDNRIIIKICDNGIGIEPNDLKNIYDRGYRGINTKNLSQASGYGLYYVKEVVIKLNANIEVINNLDKGITTNLKFLK